MISARQRAIQIARDMLSLDPVYLDTETTGLERSSEIVEICILDNQGNKLFDSLVKPVRPIPNDALRIHGIRNDDVRGAPNWLVVWPQVESVLAGRSVGIYNAEFDLRMIQQTHAIYKIRTLATTPFSPFCIMKLYAQFHGEWNRARGSYRWYSLEDAGRDCRIPLPNSHRAFDDTLLARAVLLHIANQPDTNQ